MRQNWVTTSQGYKLISEEFPAFFKDRVLEISSLKREDATQRVKDLKHEVVVKQQYELAAYLRMIEKDLVFERASMALVLKENKVLAVSRKDDHTKMGLPGGKVEYTETFEEAVLRETLEETGLEVEIVGHLFDRYDENFLGKTFLCIMKDPSAEITTTESGRVDWVEWQELFDGPFGEYNRNLYDHVEKFLNLL